MSRRKTRHAFALPALLAMLLCVVQHPVTALAQPGHGQGKGKQDKSGYERRNDKGSTASDQRGNGKRQAEPSQRGRNDEQGRRSAEQYDERGGRGQTYDRRRSNAQTQAPNDYYSNGNYARQRQSLSPQQAAQRASSQYGGQVLKVQPAGRGYQVRLLKEDGRVVEVPIGD